VSGWTPDAKALVGGVQEAEGGWDLAWLALDDPGKIVRATHSRYDEQNPALSPNGRWIAYQSNETGRSEVFACEFPTCGRRFQVSRSGASAATWRGDSRELYVNSPEGVVAFAVGERSGGLDLGPPEFLPFPAEAFGAGVHSIDGRRFIARRYETASLSEPLRLVRSWRRLAQR
jgi:hypothetical protein